MLGLALALLLLVGGLLPARRRARRILKENDALAEEILRTRRELRGRAERIRDLRYDPLTIECEMRNRGARRPGEVPVPEDEPAPRGP